MEEAGNNLPLPVTMTMLNRVAALEGQVNALTGPIFWLLTTLDPGTALSQQDAINAALSKALSFLSVRGHLISLPQT